MIKRMSSSKKIPNRNILIIDDEPDVCDLLRIYLESQNWRVTTIDSPTSALELLEIQPFFLVMTDIAMPEMDGYEFINKMHKKGIPSQIALMTGFGYNPKHTLVKINRKYKYPIFFKPFEFKKPKLKDTVQKAWDTYHKGL